MKILFVMALLSVIMTCSTYSQNSVTAEQQKEFEETARTFQMNYTKGHEKCDEILQAFDKNVQMSEIQFSGPAKSFSYEQLVQYCPYLPKKQVIETTTEQKLLTPNIGYDYVSQLYLRTSVGDTVRETSSKIWEKKNDTWKIIQINSLLNNVCY